MRFQNKGNHVMWHLNYCNDLCWMDQENNLNSNINIELNYFQICFSNEFEQWSIAINLIIVS